MLAPQGVTGYGGPDAASPRSPCPAPASFPAACRPTVREHAPPRSARMISPAHKTRLAAFFNLRRDELRPVLLSGLCFFCVLTALMVLRPARDALGMQRGIEAVRWLFVGTALVTLLVNPVFGWLVSRFSRRQFIGVTYTFFALSLAAFHQLLVQAPQAVGATSGQVFYVWFSVFNMFATMLFWALMADRFTLEQSRRLFALISVGGTLGAIFGPWLASLLARPLGTPALLLVSAAFLLLAMQAAWAVGRGQAAAACAGPDSGPQATDGQDRILIGGNAWQGLKAVFRSRYLFGIASYVIIMAIASTLLYFTRLQMVAELGDDMDLRTTVFARIDLITQAATLALQAVVAGHVMKRLGVTITLTLLPLTVMLGFVGLAMVGTLAALIVFEAVFRAVQRALARPARETLYTVLGREDKYKSKAFIDTFGYRIGDVAGAQVEGLLGRLGLGLAGLASVAVPLALAWAALGLWLGRAQLRLAHKGSASVPAIPATAPDTLPTTRSPPP
ncbi:transporter, major facilitator family protein [Bordetella bronchiseptica CA90 BB1334]|nr:transporter, major facilitator family protein [Bordetella bronchiseptica OSU054]KDB72607.1 transporter, major facilitator family protein [Bordetella bronchiseptica CA90 BB1334]KDD40639.1 transporter, major facilitator family protein [Bordetella bronchiseptica OSU095]